MIGPVQRLLSALALFCALTVGCAQQESPSDAPTPSVRRPATTLGDPLTDEEIRTFLNVLQSLPNQRAPEFEPLSQVTASERMTASQLVDVYRQEYRAMFDASRHGERWRKSAGLMSTFSQHHVKPEDYAALMIRISCAITANTISQDVDLSETSAKADAHIDQLVNQIKQLDQSARTPTSAELRLQALESLQNLVAFSEFTRVLVDVPDDSCRVVARYRDRLAGHLPKPGHIDRFERTIESQVVPTSFQQIDPGQ